MSEQRKTITLQQTNEMNRLWKYGEHLPGNKSFQSENNPSNDNLNGLSNSRPW